MIACSRKSFGMLLILGLFLLALSCVPAKNVKYGEDKISLAAVTVALEISWEFSD